MVQPTCLGRRAQDDGQIEELAEGSVGEHAVVVERWVEVPD